MLSLQRSRPHVVVRWKQQSIPASAQAHHQLNAGCEAIRQQLHLCTLSRRERRLSVDDGEVVSDSGLVFVYRTAAAVTDAEAAEDALRSVEFSALIGRGRKFLMKFCRGI